MYHCYYRIVTIVQDNFVWKDLTASVPIVTLPLILARICFHPRPFVSFCGLWVFNISTVQTLDHSQFSGSRQGHQTARFGKYLFG